MKRLLPSGPGRRESYIFSINTYIVKGKKELFNSLMYDNNMDESIKNFE